jgi:hypothetical protein
MPPVDLYSLTIPQKTEIKSALGLADTITASDPATLTNKTLVNPVFSGAGASGQLELPAQKMSTNNSAVTRGALIAEASETFLAPIFWRTPVTGGAHIELAEANGSYATLALSGATATQNAFAYVKSFNHPLVNRGSFPSPTSPITSGRFSLLFDMYTNGFPEISGNYLYEYRLLYGITTTTNVTSLTPNGRIDGSYTRASFGVVWNGLRSGKLQFHNGTSITEQSFTLPTDFSGNRFYRWMVTWNGAKLTLYVKSWPTNDSVTSFRWTELTSLTPTLAPVVVANGDDIAIAVVRTSSITPPASFSPTLSINSAYFAPYVITPNPL